MVVLFAHLMQLEYRKFNKTTTSYVQQSTPAVPIRHNDPYWFTAIYILICLHFSSYLGRV